MSVDTKSFEGLDKKEKKVALKKEAEKLGITYEEMKKKYKQVLVNVKAKPVRRIV